MFENLFGKRLALAVATISLFASAVQAGSIRFGLRTGGFGLSTFDRVDRFDDDFDAFDDIADDLRRASRFQRDRAFFSAGGFGVGKRFTLGLSTAPAEREVVLRDAVASRFRSVLVSEPVVEDTFEPALVTRRGVADAGDRPISAQRRPSFGRPLESIRGSLLARRDVDMFRIEIEDPDAFSASTDNKSTTFDTQLFLFDRDGFGVLANDDQLGSLKAELPAGSLDAEAGTYFLAISGSGRDPRSTEGNIFSGDATAVNGPTGPGGDEPIEQWQGLASRAGDYRIDLDLGEAETGATLTIAHSPTPTALGPGLMMLGVLALRRRPCGARR
jgi:hypothetical protein